MVVEGVGVYSGTATVEEPTENAVTEVREKTGRGKDRFKISELFFVQP